MESIGMSRPSPTAPRLALGLLVVGGACSDAEIIATGGFHETLIDTEIRHAQALSVADIDGDGRDDIVVALGLTDAVHVYFHPNDPALPWEIIPISGRETIVAVATGVADLDGDGDLDVAAVGQFARNGGVQSPGEIAWYENPNEVGALWRRHHVLRPAFENLQFVGGLLGARSLEVADLDADGDPDLVVGAETILLFEGNELGGGLYWFSNAGPQFPGRFRGPLAIDPGTAEARLHIDDFRVTDWDRDQRPDILAATSTLSRQRGQVQWYQNVTMTGMPRFVRRTILSGADVEYGGLQLADLDGGRPRDALILTQTGASNTAILRVDLPADFGRRLRLEPEVLADDLPIGLENGAQATVADFDGDARLDIVASTSDGTLNLYSRGSGETWISLPIRSGYLGLSDLGHSDVDDDGREDILTTTVDFGFRDRLAWWRNVE